MKVAIVLALGKEVKGSGIGEGQTEESRSSLKIYFTYFTILPKASAAKGTSSLQGIYFSRLLYKKKNPYNQLMNSQSKGIFFEVLKYLLGKLLKKFKAHKGIPEAQRTIQKKVSEAQLIIAGAVYLDIVHPQVTLGTLFNKLLYNSIVTNPLQQSGKPTGKGNQDEIHFKKLWDLSLWSRWSTGFTFLSETTKKLNI